MTYFPPEAVGKPLEIIHFHLFFSFFFLQIVSSEFKVEKSDILLFAFPENGFFLFSDQFSEERENTQEV